LFIKKKNKTLKIKLIYDNNMGYDKLTSFIIKNLSNKCFDNLYVDKNIEGSLLSKHIYFDMNFIVYNCIKKIENDINYIIKYVCASEYIDYDLIIKNIKMMNDFSKYNKYLNIEEILKYRNINKIINFIKKTIIDKLNNILYILVLDKLIFILNNIHKIEFVKYINIFFDGIPSYSKMLEQRKRRMKSYLDSIKKKDIYETKFNNIENYIINENGTIYNYFKYIENMFTIEKNFGPLSKLFINLSLYLKYKLDIIYPNKNVYINNGSINGEADYKILKHIENNKILGDISIHSCDSDFLFFIILYQLKSKNIHNYNYNFIKHSDNNYTLFNGINIINLIYDKYKYINQINNDNFYIKNNFIYDLLFIIQLFGNDIYPDNYEISGIISMDIYFKAHYHNFKENKFIVNLNNNDIINFNNLKLFLTNLIKCNLFTINILIRNFKMPYNLVMIVVNDLKYDINNFITKLVIPYLKYTKNNDIDEDDIRYKYTKCNINPIDELKVSSYIKNEIEKYFENLFDYSNLDSFGLCKKEPYYEFNDNPFQTLYNSIQLDLYKNDSKYCDDLINSYNNYLEDTKNVDINNYFNVMINYIYTIFKNYNNYNPKNKIYCKTIKSPSIQSIINFINNENYTKETCLYNNKIYFDDFTHNIFITPYLLNSVYINNKNSIIYHILNILNYQIDGLFYTSDKYTPRNIDPDEYLIKINKLINFIYNSNFYKLYLNIKQLSIIN
jgi:hypothetical protein